ncbi:hypothetical protein [Luteolibacter luteus]|uniref:Uncharacterized protein n=1 Tax=Luteolibacter luteus TaxID=2728835 RepID=A0A858RKU4_9BACT|nr:hypothetical protein [Luteolibacter luteus]QJE97557.1 hypothetical protein HHL09_17800 [Luteolibacter luteus]
MIFRSAGVSLALATALPGGEFNSPPLEAVSSWIGNSYGGARKWIQQDIAALTVMGDGTVFTNVEWDEAGGNAGEYRDGELIRYAMHTHGWGNNGGTVVAANSRYLYLGMQVGNEGGGLKDPESWPPKGKQWFGISRRPRADITRDAPFAGGKGGEGDTLKDSFLVVAEVSDDLKGALRGICADETRLFIADPYSSTLKVYDAETMQPIAEWPTGETGPLAMDQKLHLWMLVRATDAKPAHMLRIDTTSGSQSRIEGFPNDLRPIAFCFDSKGRLLVADDVSQQIRIHEEKEGRLIEIGSFGKPGGILAEKPGAFGNQKLNQVSAIGCDAKDNLYVAHDAQSGGGGTVLESYQLADATLNWRLFGLTFVDMADLDGNSAYTKEERFSMDFSKGTGKEATYSAYTINRTKYPQDPRLHIWSAGAWMRRIEDKPLLFVNDMNAEHLQVYRFAPETDGEIAIPSGFFAKKRIEPKDTWPAFQPGKGAWIWRDQDGNGAFDPAEFDKGDGQDLPAAQGWWVDHSGGIWLATEQSGLRYFPCQGLDPRGNPKWDFASMIRFPHPAEFKEVKRIRYDVTTDALYLGGTTAEDTNQHWKPMGPALARYDGWLNGEHQLTWKTILPYAKGSSGHESCEPMSFDVAGDFIFVAYTGASKQEGVKTGRVEIFRTRDGSAVGHLEPGSEIGEVGLQDIRETITAQRRENGEYMVMIEDDYKSKVVMYRIKELK